MENELVIYFVHRMDKRKSIVFHRQYGNGFSRRINPLIPSNLTNKNSHGHGEARFSWLEDNDLPLRCRRCLFLT